MGQVVSLAAAIGMPVGLALAARRWPRSWLVPAALALGAFLAVAELSWWVDLALRPHWSVADGLPLQLCDAAGLVSVAALWWRRRLLVEIAYFVGLGGALQALIMPYVPEPFPNWLFFQYYVAHGGVVAAALFLVVGMRIEPRPGAVPRMALLTAAYAALVGIVDVATGADYLYLLRPPPVPTLLDLLGPWPWRVGAVALIGLAVLLILDAPFWWRRRLLSRSSTAGT
ncbi:MAG TPA: TIGR02206 family membrane protein [Candidatus Dormibacteraeota bacterium]|nr:TIGR02206 family membrane protein [Candidatus Dormibacteraeota bacterium]